MKLDPKDKAMARNSRQSGSAVSILILTLNEENNIKDCLASVAWSNDVVLLDSGSKDKTLDIARAKGARIYHHPFENFASQQNWALQKVKFRNPWVFYL